MHSTIRVPNGYPRVRSDTRARPELNSGRVRVLPAGRFSCPNPYPTGRVPDGYPYPRVKLPSLSRLHVASCRHDATLRARWPAEWSMLEMKEVLLARRLDPAANLCVHTSSVVGSSCNFTAARLIDTGSQGGRQRSAGIQILYPCTSRGTRTL
jgi:hypothetical protein